MKNVLGAFLLALVMISGCDCGGKIRMSDKPVEYYVRESDDLIFQLPQEDFKAAQDQYIGSRIQVTGTVYYVDLPSSAERGTTYAMQVGDDNKVVFVTHDWRVFKSTLLDIWGREITVQGTVARLDLEPGYVWGHVSLKDGDIIDK